VSATAPQGQSRRSPGVATHPDRKPRERITYNVQSSLDAVLPPDATVYPRKFDLLVVDEVHQCALAGRGAYTTDSRSARSPRTSSTGCSFQRRHATATPRGSRRSSNAPDPPRANAAGWSARQPPNRMANVATPNAANTALSNPSVFQNTSRYPSDANHKRLDVVRQQRVAGEKEYHRGQRQPENRAAATRWTAGYSRMSGGSVRTLEPSSNISRRRLFRRALRRTCRGS
jgi:hypothetical protein